MTQASREVTKTGAGPHQPTVPEICSPRQRACSGGQSMGAETQCRCSATLLWLLDTHQAEEGSSHCAHTTPGHQAPGAGLQGY